MNVFKFNVTIKLSTYIKKKIKNPNEVLSLEIFLEYKMQNCKVCASNKLQEL